MKKGKIREIQKKEANRNHFVGTLCEYIGVILSAISAFIFLVKKELFEQKLSKKKVPIKERRTAKYIRDSIMGF